MKRQKSRQSTQGKARMSSPPLIMGNSSTSVNFGSTNSNILLPPLSSPLGLHAPSTSSRSSSRAPSGSPLPNVNNVEREEQLQLCIQRFVRDSQSMMNQFSELFVAEVRRFADVCLEFSVAYRNVQDDREFLNNENQSIKDELDARSYQLEMLQKELRETREENEELMRRFECLNVTNGSAVVSPATSQRFLDPVAMARHYAVVNSMPAFPRRYSVAASVASYEAYDGEQTTQSNANSRVNFDSLLPDPSRAIHCQSASPTMNHQPQPQRLSPTNRSNDAKRSRSKDRLSDRKSAEFKYDPYSHQRSPSLDQIPSDNESAIAQIEIQASIPTLSAISTSAGTFYDAVSHCSTADMSSRHPSVSIEGKSCQDFTEEIEKLIVMLEDNDDDANTDIEQSIISIPETLRLHQSTSATPLLPVLNAKNRKSLFISKTPSPGLLSFDEHLSLYHAKSQDENQELSPTHLDQTKWYHQNDDEPLVGFEERPHFDIVSIIPNAVVEMNRYLLVEVSHFISPSHFYLLVNDEKYGLNALEDFLESFQSFYRELEYLCTENPEDDEEEQSQKNRIFTDLILGDDSGICDEWKAYFTSPPPLPSITVGSFWAAIIDDDYDWRRVLVESPLATPELEYDSFIQVCDVDSGFSTLIPAHSLRPLTDEFGSIAAFAIRASLAYLYPRVHQQEAMTSPDELWPEESCRLFEKLTFDQMLTASIIEVRREDLTDTEVAQVLLWCSPNSSDSTHGNSSSHEDEIFINKKLIELNFAANVADDDRWLQKSMEVVCLPDNLEEPAPVPRDSRETTPTPEVVTIKLTLPGKLVTEAEVLNVTEHVEEAAQKSPKKKKIKSRSVKKKSAETSRSGPEEETSMTPTVSENIVIDEPNKLLHSSSAINDDQFQRSEEYSCAVKICSTFYNNHCHHHTSSSSLSSKSSPCKYPHEFCPYLHHDPRLSNWIVQKYSRLVKLKKCSFPTQNSSTQTPTSGSTMFYLFYASTVFDQNKIIGILPFGEKKLDLNNIEAYYEQLNSENSNNKISNIESPFKQFIDELSIFYKNSHQSLKLFDENAAEMLNIHNQAIVFYESRARLFLRGYIIGRDPDSRPSTGISRMSMENVLDAVSKHLLVEPEVKRKTASLKRPKGPSFVVHEIDIDAAETDPKPTKPEVKSASPRVIKWIVYGIDTGQYYLIKSCDIFKLVEQFALAKPFAIVAKISHPQLKSNGSGGSNQQELKEKFQKLAEHRFHCLQYQDVDFTTERNLVSLFLFKSKDHSLENVLDFI